MKLKNEQEIENLADSEHRHLNIARKVWTFKDGYKSGYTQAQQDILASASESFEELRKDLEWAIDELDGFTATGDCPYFLENIKSIKDKWFKGETK